MDEEDLLPTQPAPGEVFALRNLEPMSVEELAAYIAVLEGEIERVRADITAKQVFRNDADAVFRK